MIEWGFVPLHIIIPELKLCTDTHHSEISDEPLNIDWDTYQAASEAGQAVAVTARDSGKLVGYIVFTISRNLRFSHILEASSSGWYVEPEYRNQIDMAEKADELLKAAGVHETNYTVDGGVGKLLQRKGYKMTHQVFTKKYRS